MPVNPLAALEDELLAFRRDLHAYPELSHAETRTTARVAARLTAAGVRVRLLTGTGLIGDIGAVDPAYRVALRADMDALPLTERTGLAFASQSDGVCHACGHDVHVAAVLGAGLALQEQADSLAAQGLGVRLIFQPAEEVTPGGALGVIEQGGIQGVDAIFSIHCDPTLDVGLVGLRDGPITAATDSLTITLSGRGGHTSRPHLTQDLIYALGKVVTDVPAALSRRVDPRSGVALVWGTVHSGSAENVIPSTGTVSGTLRMLDAQLWKDIGPLLEELVPCGGPPVCRVRHDRAPAGGAACGQRPGVGGAVARRRGADAGACGTHVDCAVSGRRGLRLVSAGCAGGHGAVGDANPGRQDLRPPPGGSGRG